MLVFLIRYNVHLRMYSCCTYVSSYPVIQPILEVTLKSMHLLFNQYLQRL